MIFYFLFLKIFFVIICCLKEFPVLCWGGSGCAGTWVRWVPTGPCCCGQRGVLGNVWLPSGLRSLRRPAGAVSYGPISRPLPLTPGAIPLLLEPAVASPRLMAEPELRPRQEGERWKAPEVRLSRDRAGGQAGVGSAVSPRAGGGGKEKAPGWEGGCTLRASSWAL